MRPAELNPKGAAVETVARFGLRQFARSAGVLSISSLAGFMRAVITAKLFAVTLGPSAVGVLAQLLNFSALVSVLIPLGLTTGVVKMVAEAGGAERRLNRIVLTSSVLAVGSGLAATLVLVPFAGAVSLALTGQARYAVLVVVIIASFPLYNLSGVLGYVLQGLADVDRLTRANVLNALLSLIVLVPLTLAFGLTGAALSVLASSVVQLAIFGWALWRAYAARALHFIGGAFDRPTARMLLAYGGIVLVGSVVTWASVLAVRTITFRLLGESANGLYQVVFGMSTQYITAFMTWMAAYVFPRVVTDAPQGKLNQLLNSGLRANLAIMVPILVISIALREPLIRIFYSSAFLPAASLVPLQVLGDYIRIIGWSFAVCLFAVGRTRSHLAVVSSQSVAWVVLASVLIPIYGLSAVPATYALSFLTYPLLGVTLTHRWVGAAPDRRSLLLIGLGLACVLGAALPFYLGVLLAPILPATIYLLNRHELWPGRNPV